MPLLEASTSALGLYSVSPGAASKHRMAWSYVKNGAVDIDGYRRDVINIRIDDPTDSEDYYLFRMLTTRTHSTCAYDSTGVLIECYEYSYGTDLHVSSPDPTLRQTSVATVGASDRSFNGTRRDFRLEVDNYNDEDGYRYLTSRYAARQADGNPFAEPVTVHENIEGGVGIFMVSSRVEALVRR